MKKYSETKQQEVIFSNKGKGDMLPLCTGYTKLLGKEVLALCFGQA